MPLTLTVFGLWLMFDRIAQRKQDLDADDDDNKAKRKEQLEARITTKLRRRTGIRVAGIAETGQP